MGLCGNLVYTFIALPVPCTDRKKFKILAFYSSCNPLSSWPSVARLINNILLLLHDVLALYLVTKLEHYFSVSLEYFLLIQSSTEMIGCIACLTEMIMIMVPVIVLYQQFEKFLILWGIVSALEWVCSETAIIGEN